MGCSEWTCRGGVACCRQDASLGAYCVSDTFCTAVAPLWETIFIPVFLLLATLGVLLVVYSRYRHLRPRPFSLADFVERELRLDPADRYEHTKLKTVTSFE